MKAYSKEDNADGKSLKWKTAALVLILGFLYILISTFVMALVNYYRWT